MQQSSKTRLLSLDIFRGLVVAATIIVNSPGNHSAYSWLEHSLWSGCTFADLVFPFFIFIVGISSVLALTHLRQSGHTTVQLFSKIIRRSLYIFFLGLLLNVLPLHFDFSTLRILGVLQRIALCYLFASLLFLTTTKKTQLFIIGFLLLAYWLFITQVFTVEPSLNANLVGSFDLWLLSSSHLYSASFDPEGLLSTLPAIASALLGSAVGYKLVSSSTNQQKLQWLLVFGFMLSLTGWLWSYVFLFSKPLWTSSYVLWTAGLCSLAFALCFWLIEMKGWSLWSKPFLIFGESALLVYLLHVLCLKIQAVFHLHSLSGEEINLRLYITERLFSHFSPKNASLCYALAYTVFWFLILTVIAKWQALFKDKNGRHLFSNAFWNTIGRTQKSQ